MNVAPRGARHSPYVENAACATAIPDIPCTICGAIVERCERCACSQTFRSRAGRRTGCRRAAPGPRVTAVHAFVQLVVLARTARSAPAHRTVSSTIRRSASGPCCRECSLHRSRRIRRRVGRAAPLIPRCARVSCAIGRRAAMASAAAGLPAAGAHIWPPAPSALAQQKILKFIPQTDLRIDPRSGHDDRAHHAQPWLHGVRHAVRHGREVPESSPQMVDNYDVSAG